jgi:ubiquitin C-terminal hydrolase
MYEGSMRNEIKCLKCGNISYKVEKFMDLSLPVRNEFDKIYNSSLEMALCNLVKPEKLEKDNQYFCEQCKVKV